MNIYAALLAISPLLHPDPLSDLSRFPPHKIATENRCFASCHLQWLDWQMRHSSYFAEQAWQWKEDAAWCHACWDALEDANGPASDCWRRERLATLKHLLGEELYGAGCMPPAVPVWWFRRID